ncbi:glycosyltransferase family 4 protein [Microbacterium pygmaeum]|uniref:Glycosyl transferases group 1 n=1 Tax=Microbacterium pygmaeum TaxID=370764 RepID=A0A1G8E099_9MICO|nr:glycosyltransferase family 4 protein [Microbacterium pygmaeum]SDG33035.1 Glycosyl transferases group 1 [Microbacterium pygmaeum]SDH63119.1 Glycosyl transferases group 1 [Microbacterium pygmaeum]
MDWKAVIGIRPTASGAPLKTSGVRELEFTWHGRDSVRRIREIAEVSPEIASSDVVISLISQSDIAFSRSRARASAKWVAWVRGKPWPAAGEQSLLRRLPLRWLETRALRSADEVWATTPVLASEFAAARAAEIVPAGIGGVSRTSWGTEGAGPLVWAGRVDVDKRPGLFIDIVEKTRHPGRLFGEGPLTVDLQKRHADGLTWAGWADADELWNGASVFVGTSAREAFGRSAVEAAAAGLPIVIARDYGAAPLLVTSDEMRRACVVESDDPEVWANAVRRILDDQDLRRAVSDHVYANAKQLTIAASVKIAAERAMTLVDGVRSI